MVRPDGQNRKPTYKERAKQSDKTEGLRQPSRASLKGVNKNKILKKTPQIQQYMEKKITYKQFKNEMAKKIQALSQDGENTSKQQKNKEVKIIPPLGQIPDDPIHLIPSSLAKSCTAPISLKTNPPGDLPRSPKGRKTQSKFTQLNLF